jgi:hypothetical protein
MGRQITLHILGRPVQVALTAAPGHRPGRTTHRQHRAACAQRRGRAQFELSGPELDRFNELHTRGFGGRFGRKLAELAGVDRDDQNTQLSLTEDPDTERPNSEFTYFRIRGPGLVTDQETDEIDTGEAEVLLHMAPRDYEELGKAMSAAILREKLKGRPLDDDDPLSLYLHSMLDLQDSSTLAFDREANPWYDNQVLEFTPDGDGSWQLLAEDEWGDQVDMTLTGPEFAALHAQLMRRVGTGPQPTGAKPVTKGSPPSAR